MFETFDLTTIAIVFVVLVISITIHEAMHAFTGYWLGDDTAKMEGRISLNPIRHIDPYLTILLPMITLILFQLPMLVAKPVPFNPYRVRFEEFGAALVGISGPLTNLLLATAGAGILNIVGGGLGVFATNVLTIFVIINIALFVFNMMPIPPLDGSRLIYAFAPESVQRFMASMEQFGIFVIFGLVLLVPAFGQLLFDLNQQILNFLL